MKNRHRARKDVVYSGVVLNDDKLASILERIKYTPIETLRFINCELRDQEAKQLAQIITQDKTFKKLKCIDLRRNHISTTGISILEDSLLNKRSRISFMDLRFNEPLLPAEKPIDLPTTALVQKKLIEEKTIISKSADDKDEKLEKITDKSLMESTEKLINSVIKEATSQDITDIPEKKEQTDDKLISTKLVLSSAKASLFQADKKTVLEINPDMKIDGVSINEPPTPKELEFEDWLLLNNPVMNLQKLIKMN